MTSLKDIPQFAYLLGRGLSDALDRVVAHLRDARTLLQNAHALQQGAHVPDLVGGITFALDLSQAFDTVSRQEIISLLTSTRRELMGTQSAAYKHCTTSQNMS